MTLSLWGFCRKKERVSIALIPRGGLPLFVSWYAFLVDRRTTKVTFVMFFFFFFPEICSR